MTKFETAAIGMSYETGGLLIWWEKKKWNNLIEVCPFNGIITLILSTGNKPLPRPMKFMLEMFLWFQLNIDSL
jgi:hypothetical protein